MNLNYFSDFQLIGKIPKDNDLLNILLSGINKLLITRLINLTEMLSKPVNDLGANLLIVEVISLEKTIKYIISRLVAKSGFK